MSNNTSQSMSFSDLVIRFLAALLLAVSVPAMAQDNAQPDGAAAESDRFEGKLMIDEDEMSSGMRLPFDGSSTEAFERSMESIRAETTEVEFTTVQNAIDYLLVYDLAARRNPEMLYKRLDGKTPAEMLKMVNWQTGKRGTRNR